jgi:hypothetical protein
MKNYKETSTRIGMLLLITIAVLGISAKGQTLEYKVRANIPFDFTVGGKKFAAGSYSIVRAGLSNGDQILQIATEDLGSRVYSSTYSLQGTREKNKPTLVFHRYGDEYFLAQIWPAWATTGRGLPKSHREKDLQKSLSSSGVGKQTPITEIVTLTP